MTARQPGRLVWPATDVDGNLTYTAPTIYPASMAREQVIAAIRRRTPEIEVNS